jgi:hypothetical protein
VATLQLAKGWDVEYGAVFALALAGDSSGSQKLADDLEKRFPQDTPVAVGPGISSHGRQRQSEGKLSELSHSLERRRPDIPILQRVKAEYAKLE